MMSRVLFCLLAYFATAFTSLVGDAFLTTPSLHVLIATIGRESLLSMLHSLQPQLGPKDYLTIVFDAKDQAGIYLNVDSYLKDFQCTTSLIMEPENLGCWGHAIRNKHNQLHGDFVLHADDDDIYAVDALDTIRASCLDDSTLYMFRMQYSNGHTLWAKPIIQLNNIGTPMGVIPSKYNSQGVWGLSNGGDSFFYLTLANIVPHVAFIDHVIYLVSPNLG